LPNLISLAFKGEKELAVDLTKAETYNDVIPYRTNGISAWISIMRGCNNFCSYCVVPYTRGRERSRPMETILNEIKMLANSNCKDITLLGQNVNSYSYLDKNMNKERTIDFPTLLENVALTHPNIRIRFLTSHPRNLSKELVDIIAGYDNICNSIHLPVQSGSNNVLKLMNRKYSVEHYLELIDMIKSKIPNCALSTDIIAGYPDETLDDHKATLNLMKKVRYHNAFMFRYSPREGTKAFGCVDNIPEEEKIRRLNEIIELQNKISLEENQKLIGTSIEILVEKQSKKNQNEWLGRTKTSNLVVFENNLESDAGDLLNVKIEKATSATLFGKIIVD
jgi:tRNA-2-methylthio-N6-dimethylallyladenosine synthase